LRERLRHFYGAEAGQRTFEELQHVLGQAKLRLPSSTRTAGRFDERDVLLITYGDSFQAEGRRPLEALESFASRHLAQLVSAIHLLPFFPYSSDYGFAVIDYERVDPKLGDWPDIVALRARFELMFDFVLNHVSAESGWFEAFRRGEEPYSRFFITLDPATDLSGVTRPRTSPLLTPFDTVRGRRWLWTTFGADQVDLDYSNPEVLLAMVGVMLDYVARGAGLLRLDAVGYLWKQLGTPCVHLPQTHEVVRLFRDVLDQAAPHVSLVTETNVPQAENISYFGSGTDEAQMVYQFPLAPLVLDALRRGDGRHLSGWARGIETPSDRTTFLNFLASHDGIGLVPASGILPAEQIDGLVAQVRKHGGEVSFKSNPDGSQTPYELNCTFFDALSDPNDESESWELKRDRFLCAQAIMLALPGVPGIYVHSLFGSHNDEAGYRRSGWKRDLNHERLWLPTLEEELRGTATERAQVFDGMTRLVWARRAQPAFHPASAQEVLDLGPGLFAIRRGPHRGRSVVALHNLTARVQDAGPFGALQPYEVAWREA
jgi:glycosidase